MKRRDVLDSLVSAEPAVADTPRTPPGRARIQSGAVRAMGLSLDHLQQQVEQANQLQDALATGDAVVELDPELVDDSFLTDRLARTSDPDYRKLVDSCRERGQLVPILVRPHPSRPGRYQIAFGHRRRDAARELGHKVKAIIRHISDQDLVIAQGKENAERRNLSFIERALFAAALESQGYTRATVQSALGLQAAEASRLITVANSVPRDVTSAIGPAPRAGRSRWLELARLLHDDKMLSRARALMSEFSFARLNSDRRINHLIDALRTNDGVDEPILFRNASGKVVIRAEKVARTLRFSVEEGLEPGLTARVLAALEQLVSLPERE